jgi:galactokinase
MSLAKAGHLARVAFHPFRVTRHVPIPNHAALLIAHSGEHAVQKTGARDCFNQRVACCQLGMLLIRQRNARLASRLRLIRDLLPSRLKSSPSEVYKIIQALPVTITRRQLRRRLGPPLNGPLDRIFASHVDPGHYAIRDVVTYAVAECARSQRAAGDLERGDLTGFGHLMLLSHDGDRVSGKPTSLSLTSRTKSKTPSPALHSLIGAYGCSTESIDRIVDIARALPGVYGAQLAGPGLGGCVMILAERAAASRVKAALTKAYYLPRGMAPAVRQVRSVSAGRVDPA